MRKSSKALALAVPTLATPHTQSSSVQRPSLRMFFARVPSSVPTLARRAATCGSPAVSFDDRLHDITVPVLYIGAGGGFGEYGLYNLTLLGSTDVTTHIVHQAPAGQRLADFGHADLFLGNAAQTLAWQPILDWVRTH